MIIKYPNDDGALVLRFLSESGMKDERKLNELLELPFDNIPPNRQNDIIVHIAREYLDYKNNIEEKNFTFKDKDWYNLYVREIENWSKNYNIKIDKDGCFSYDFKRYSYIDNTEEIGEPTRFGIKITEWFYLTKQKQIEIAAEKARQDKKRLPDYWRGKFRENFSNYSMELARYRKKFKKQHPDEKFIINGLTFYSPQK